MPGSGVVAGTGASILGRKAPLYRAFFEDAPNEIVRLSLAPEVNELERFQRVLATTPEAAPLRACWEPRIAAVIERAKSALAQRGAAAVEDAQSDELARRWIEIADRLRRSISGALRTYAAENGLPRDFEDRFFPPPPRKRRRRAGGGED